MPIIKPISDLRNKSLEISKLVHKSNEPVFITRKGEGDMVLMSMECYDRMYVFGKLMEARASIAAGDKGVPAEEAMRVIREKLGLRDRRRK